MIDDLDLCYRAVSSRDQRFDGWFYTGVTTTGIYCRPSCPALTPKRSNVRFFATAAAAHRAGFRACKRCRPDAAPGSPQWDHRGDVVARAMRLVADGVVDRDGVGGLARRLGYSERQLNRQLLAEVGAGPLALARAQRAATARLLIETTALPLSEVAFAAGFASIRQFNDTIRSVFAATPTQLRTRRSDAHVGGADTVTVRLAYRRPFAAEPALRFLARRAVPGVEHHDAGGTYTRALNLPHGEGVVALTPADGHVRAALRLSDLRDLTAAVSRCRRLLDLDADAVAVDEALSADPILRPLVAATPGRRVVGAVDGGEIAIRGLLGQQISVAAARTHAARLVARYGKPLTTPVDGVTHLFPDMSTLAAADPASMGLPRRRSVAIIGVAAAVAGGEVTLDSGAEPGTTRAAFGSLPGVGPWTTEYVAMRALRDPDAFPGSDLALRRAADGLGIGAGDLDRHAARWRPWRAYAAEHLWASLEAPT